MISLIIPVYNVAPYLRKCLDSILYQDSRDWEALLIDDGSTDASGAICDEYAGKDSRFRVFHKENGGVSSARNVGLDNAKGDWIWFVDGDDWIKTDSIGKLSQASAQYDCDMIIFGIEYYGEDLNVVGVEKRNLVVDKSKDEIISPWDYPPQNYLVRLSVINEYNLRFSEGVPMGEDLEFQYKCLICCRRPISIPDILYCYLRRQGSATKNSNSRINAANSSVVVMEHLVEFVFENNTEERSWLSARMNRVFKNVLSSNSLVGRYDKDIQSRFRNSVNNLREIGFNKFIDSAIRIGYSSIRIYSAYIKARNLFKK